MKVCVLFSLCAVNLVKSQTKFCEVNFNESAVIVSKKNCSRDDTELSYVSTYSNQKAEKLFLSSDNKTWHTFSSLLNQNPIFNLPVFDQRWEYFINTHDAVIEIQDILKNATILKNKIFLSYKNCNASDKTWKLFSVENEYFNENRDNKYSSINSSKKVSDDALFEEYSIWKLHKYNYLYANTTDTSTIYNKSENCTQFEEGCLIFYLVKCKECDISINLTHSNSSMFSLITQKNITGWSTEGIPLMNFSTCFNFTITTNISEKTNNSYWALGDFAHLVTNGTCKNLKRNIEINNTENNELVCETVQNKMINFSDTLSMPKRHEKIKTQQPKIIQESQPDKSSFNGLYLLIIVPVVLLIGAAIGIYWFKFKTNLHTCSPVEAHTLVRLDNTNAGEETVRFLQENILPIACKDFPSYVQELFKNQSKNDILKNEFELLPSGFLKPAENGKKPENVDKNRFQKIYPYDENRVILKDSDENSDYINASYIDGLNAPNEYIITQNPLKNTITDFCRMIWQEEVDYIVMVSSTDEKYFKYWPEINEKKIYGDFEISAKKFTSYEFYDYRIFSITRNKKTKQINQLHFHAWSTEMLSSHVFIEFINHLLSIPHSTSPVVFHCLAGIGRSATIVLCDMAIRSSALVNTYNFFEITKKLRESRPDSVPNLKQYQLAHLIVYETRTYRDTSTEINSDFEASFSRLLEDNVPKQMWSTYLENTEWLHEALSSYAPCTAHPKKNRYPDQNLCPVEHSRVVLQYRDPDYIHAMYVNDFSQSKKIIVAQQPLRSTVQEFWLMILQNHVTLFFNLNEFEQTNYRGEAEIFPTAAKQFIKCGNIGIKLLEEQPYSHYDKITVAVYSEGKYQYKVCILNIKGWPKIKTVPGSTDTILSIFDIAKEQPSQNFPILICCDDGITSSSLVASFFYMAEKMLQMKKCDIVGAVRAVRRTHTKFVNFDQFVFLHHCALAFYKNCFKRHSVLNVI